MAMDLVGKAFERFRTRGSQPPQPGTKDWWSDRSCMLEMQLASRGDNRSTVERLPSVSPSNDDMSAYRLACMKDVLTWTQWPVMTTHLQRACPWVTNVIRSVTWNSTDEKKKRKARKASEARQRNSECYERLRGLQNEVVLSILQRQRSIHNTPLLLVLKSMVAFRQGLNHEFWLAESKMRLLMSPQWTHDLILELSEEGVKPPFPLARRVAFVVYDNCDYHNKKALDRYNDPADYIQTVNIASVPVPARLDLDPANLGESNPIYFPSAWEKKKI